MSESGFRTEIKISELIELPEDQVKWGTNEYLEVSHKEDDGSWLSYRIAIGVLKGNKGDTGDAGRSAYQVAVDNGYSGNRTEWLRSLVGQNAYDLAVQEGFQGTLTEWLDSLAGDNGENGTDGTDGTDGATAYELALANGFEGTEQEWLATLEGQSAYDVAVAEGFEGSKTEWLASLKGDKGDAGSSAFELAVAEGFQGDETEWLQSLVGKSAYDVAVENGFEGTKEEWLESLKGSSVYEVAVDNGFEGTEQEFLDSLKGDKGDEGNRGMTPYEYAVSQGFEGTPEQWLKSLKGEASSGLVILGSFTSTDLLPKRNNEPGHAYIVQEKMWVWDGDSFEPVGQRGPTGASAYQAAVATGFTGTLRQWLISLEGDSAYQIAVEQGFEGTKAQWLETLKGRDAFEIWQEELGNTGTYADFILAITGEKGETGDKGETGPQGDPANAIQVKGGVPSEADLPDNAEVGDGYFIPVQIDNETKLALFVRTDTDWFNAGPVSGPQGVQGDRGETGPQGKSAYEVAQDNGFEGSVQDWILSLRGESGESVYAMAQRVNGFADTEEAFLESLVGDTGESAYEIAQRVNGFQGTEQEFLDSLKGEEGERGPVGPTGSGLEIAQVVATEADLPDTAEENAALLVRDNGHVYFFENGAFVDGGPIAGLSAYDLAVDNGYTGTVEEWLGSLKGDAGLGLVVLGRVDTQNDLPDPNATDTTLNPGECYYVGPADGQRDLWTFDGQQWQNLGIATIGLKGDTGENGKSAFELAQQTGFEGTQDEWLTSLEGDSAYALAVENGFAGSVNDWLESLKGLSAYQLAVSQGYTGTLQEWLAETEGSSAFEVAQANGFEGTVEDWLATLRGEDGKLPNILGTLNDVSELPADAAQGDAYFIGENIHVFNANGDWVASPSLIGPQGDKGDPGNQGDPGPSIYDVAVSQGFEGTQQDFLDSLKGASAYQVAVDNGFEGTVEEWRESLKGLSAFEVYQAEYPDEEITRRDWLESLDGTRWINGSGPPNAVTGYTGDYYLDNDTFDYYQKTSDTNWGLVGKFGGGNVYAPPQDDQTYVYQNGEWILLTGTAADAPQDDKLYGVRNGIWSEVVADVEEAPSDDAFYARQNAGWTALVFDTDGTAIAEGTDTTIVVTPASFIAFLRDELGITKNEDGEWVNDEGHQPQSQSTTP